MSECLVSIIIPVWNRWELTHACLESLRQYTTNISFEVITVDNGSDDETTTSLSELGKKLFENQFRTIRLEENTGFGPACNVGAAEATGEFLLFLNNDTLLTENWLPPLYNAFTTNPRLGAAGPLLLYPDTHRVQHCGVAFTPSLRTEHLYCNFPANHPAVHATRVLQAISGAVMMLPRTFFHTMGGFHHGYKNGSEDLELCCRVREAGRTLDVITQSVVYHLESQTPGRGDHDEMNAALLGERCKGCFGPDMHRFAKADGYQFALTPWLESYIALSPEREEELTRPFINQFDPSGCWEQLQKEPLWHTGYAMLANALEQAEQFQEASGLRLLQTYFFPMLPYYQQLATCAARAGNESLTHQAIEKAQHVNTLLEDPGPLAKKAAGLTNWAKKAGERDLQMLYEGWLRDLGLL